jgi:LysM repeat protein/ABC-type branched-subunit amino acid transport system substrate-binding protein
MILVPNPQPPLNGNNLPDVVMSNLRFFLRINIRLLVLVILFMNCSALLAQETPIKRSTVIEQYKGKPFYLHFVLKGETLNAISKAYNVSKEELILDNPSLQDGLKADQVLRIPQRSEPIQPATGETVEKKDIFLEIKPSASEKKETGERDHEKQTQIVGKTYTVKKKETLYGIAKQFNISVDDLQKANPQLTGLQEGMEIVIPLDEKKFKNADEEVGDSKTKENSKKTELYQEIKVQHGQTVYSISREYGITIEKFLSLNPGADQGLKTDQLVKVPAPSGSMSNNEIVGAQPAHMEDNPATRKPAKQKFPNEAITDGSVKDSCGRRPDPNKTFEIALLLPFDLEQADSILTQDENSIKTANDFKSYDFFQFYSGILLAADSLEKIGFRARINVFDADKEADTLKIKKAMRKIDLKGMDLIIGPVFAKSFDVASRFALKENVNIINPLSKRNKILAGNPHIYMVQSSEEAMAFGLASYITRHYQGSNVIICRNGLKEQASFAASFLRNLKKQDSLSGLRIKEVNYAVESFAGLTKNLSSQKHNIVLLFSDSRSIVPNFVSLLNTANKNQDITLFGLPGWENLGIESEFLSRLDYHQVTPDFVDYNSAAVNQFVKQFRETYSTEPLIDNQAFLGFDIGWYFFQALMNYGPDFGPCLRNFEIEGLQTNFSFPVESPNVGKQNSSYQIIELNDYKWVESP